MLPLESQRWSRLSHAYGDAAEIPKLLADLEALPADDTPEAEPYFSLWSALCHQGDIYLASYAAVPHVVRVMATASVPVPWTLFLLVSCIEIARQRGRGPELPADLEADYREALARIPSVVERVAAGQWSHLYCGAVLSAVAAAKGQVDLAEAILELDPDTVGSMLRAKNGEDV